MISTRDLSKSYGSRRALDSVSARVREGEIYGLVGPNGAGKTTLLGLLAGLRKPTSGTIELAVDRTQMAVLPDTPQFEPWLTAREVVDLSRNLTAPRVPGTRVEQVLRESGLGDVMDVRTGGFSRGMLQRLGLAATVVAEPKILLLDEPSAALDPGGRREVLDLVARLRGRSTVLFSSHILSDVQEVCDTVGILREGKLLFEGPLDELLVGRAGALYRVRLREPNETVLAALGRAPWVTEVNMASPTEIRIATTGPSEVEENLAGLLAGAHARVVSIGPESPSLEDVFLELTS